MHIDGVPDTCFQTELPDGFEKWLAFNITTVPPTSTISTSAACFPGQHNDPLLDLIGNMRITCTVAPR